MRNSGLPELQKQNGNQRFLIISGNIFIIEVLLIKSDYKKGLVSQKVGNQAFFMQNQQLPALNFVYVFDGK